MCSSDLLSEIFTNLCVRVAGDLQRKAFVGRTVGIKLRYEDFRTVTRDITLPLATDAAADIRRAVGECLKRVAVYKRLRLLGVRVGTLTKKSELPQTSLPQQSELMLTEALIK